MKKNLQQSGRSMVEMLGVLAVVGVLSIGGIAGYKSAMDQNEANDFINALMIDFTQIKGMLQNNSVNLDDSSPVYESSMPDYIKEKYGKHHFQYLQEGEVICNNVEIYPTKNLCQKLRDFNWNSFENMFGKMDNYNAFDCNDIMSAVVITMCIYKE